MCERSIKSINHHQKVKHLNHLVFSFLMSIIYNIKISLWECLPMFVRLDSCLFVV